MFALLPSALRLLLASALWPANPTYDPPPELAPLRFHLRHEHALSPSALNVFRDISLRTDAFSAEPVLALSAAPVTVHRPRSRAEFRAARARWRPGGEPTTLDWDDTDVPGPNVSSRETLQTLAKMTNNAYSEPGDKEWYDLGGDWDVVRPLPLLTMSARAADFGVSSRGTRSGGNRTWTASAVTSSSRRTTRRSSSPSRVPLPAGSSVGAVRQ